MTLTQQIMKKSLKNLMIAAIILASSIGCKKISTPNEDAKKIFGSWTYDLNSGGFSGAGGSTRFSNDNWIEITDKGYFKIYEGSKKKSQKRFKIEMKESIYDANQRPALVYNNGDYESYQIFNDTLYISDEAYDGYTYRFVKK